MVVVRGSGGWGRVGFSRSLTPAVVRVRESAIGVWGVGFGVWGLAVGGWRLWVVGWGLWVGGSGLVQSTSSGVGRVWVWGLVSRV